MKIVYPEGKKKALTFSYDDNQIFDRRLIAILNRYGLKGTFHLNSGTVNTKQDGNEYVAWEEIPNLYQGHEVACHGVNHPFMAQLSGGELVRELADDRKNLEQATGYPVRGLSYPFGEYSDEIIQAAKTVGIEYSRTVCDTHGYNWPSEFLTWNPTCHHNEAFSNRKLIDDFLTPPGYLNLPLLYIWGHSFEFERENTWEQMETFCKKVSGKADVWYATNIEIKEYVEAVRRLVTSMDGKMVYNPSAAEIYYEVNQELNVLKAGETVFLA